MRTVQVFVFGTLRVNSSRWAEDAEVAEPVENCTVKGLMYNYGPYPYVDFDGDDTVVGDLLTFDADHPSYLGMCRVEIGAGYHERELRVTTPDGRQVDCYGWDVTPSTRERLVRHEVPTVKGGDWHKRYENTVYA